LHVDCATQSRIGAAELEEHPVAGGLHYVPTVLGDLGIDQLLADVAQAGERARIVTLHVPAVADHVRDDDRS